MMDKLSKPSNCDVVDLFCGIGGLTHGFVREGFRVKAGYDLDVSCKFAYEENNDAPFIEKAVERTTPAEISAHFDRERVSILVGCAPCQPFSLYTLKQPKNEKWELLNEFKRLILGVSPDIVSMENVPDLGKHEIFDEFVTALQARDYHVFYEVVHCVDYGVAQNRSRLVLLASKFGPISMVKKTHPPSRWRTVRDVIGRLPKIKAGQRSARDRIHQARALSPMNLKRIQHTKQGGSWHDWPEELVLACHKKSSGETYRSIYGRMRWDEAAPTLTTHCTGIGNGRYGHPEQDRAISLREAALLQSFPRKYKFVARGDKLYNKTLSRQLGNAVPVRLGQVIARSIARHLEEIAKDGSSHQRATKLSHVARQDARQSAGTVRSH
jgi:DNA (cytosine-5)-methyltransferase 1